MGPNLNNVRHRPHTRLLEELKESSKDLYKLLNKIIENSDYLKIRATKPIKNLDELITLIENSNIDDLEKMLTT